MQPATPCLSLPVFVRSPHHPSCHGHAASTLLAAAGCAVSHWLRQPLPPTVVRVLHWPSHSIGAGLQLRVLSSFAACLPSSPFQQLPSSRLRHASVVDDPGRIRHGGVRSRSGTTGSGRGRAGSVTSLAEGALPPPPPPGLPRVLAPPLARLCPTTTIPASSLPRSSVVARWKGGGKGAVAVAKVAPLSN